jgi:Nucleotidyl transferase AbiEii toxin, Type IV TA system
MDAATDVSQFPKFFFRSSFESGGGRLQIKVEINTYETSPARQHTSLPYRVVSPWWSGDAEVLTYEPAELIATKLRALYQRRKGRDLYDLWLALTQLALDPNEIIDCFGPYRPDGYTTASAKANLERHVADAGFRSDLVDLVGEEIGFDVDEAAGLVTAQLLDRLDQT